MEKHPSYPALAEVLPKYPQAAGALFQTYNDLKLAQQWSDLEVLDLPSCSRGALRGKRPQMDDTLYVIPCSLPEAISTGWLYEAFKELGSPPHVYLAINAEDSSIVYYKISPGIVKPPV
ncbi:tRNA-splicing endonuclease subunit Sen15 [Gelatoporia subvermispora B]|uniref:tRNA-splicing endonuclease subunit Sen15 n=1 Tax=Ceriporiopsis subvermispora (strain B) TaxID=914234 RepID=M2QHC4_CERS8|nr:tRNA-splicing endonuclease subunit Sen15 [Gelatoporia subvermispora B]